MSDPMSMSFSLNQAAINAAIQAALPSLLKELEFDYTAGRAPKGLTAQVTLNEKTIRQALTTYARRTVNASFTHFSIEFQPTRGDDGVIANITASSAPIAASESETEAQAEVASKSEAVADKASAEPAEQAETVSEAAGGEVVAEAAETTTEASSGTRPSKLFSNLARPDNSAE